jgi:hypothetical protein
VTSPDPEESVAANGIVRRDRAAALITAVVVHAAMGAGFLLGRFDGGATVLGVLLDSLVAYVAWLIIYLRLRPDGKAARELVAKTFVGLSFGVWGFIAMFRAITLRDTVLLSANAAMLDGLSGLSGIDGDGAAIILVLIAIALLIASLYFLGKIMVEMSPVDLAWVGVGVVIIRVFELVRYVMRHRDTSRTEKLEDAEDHLTELCLHVFVKGWFGALLMTLLVDVPFALAWVYLAWSCLYDVLLRAWLWRKFGARVRAKVVARVASRKRVNAQAT